MLEIEKVSENLFDKIRSRFTSINIGDENAKATVDPTKARFFNFDFTHNGEDYGNITFSLVDEQAIKVYYDQEIDKNMDAETRQAWYSFLKDIRLFAKRHMMTFDIRDIAKSGLNLSDLKHANKDAEVYDSGDIQVTEGKLYGTTRSSYQKMESVRIIARHSKPVDEQQLGARARNIRALYIENSEGERFKLPEGTTLNGARAYARHVMNGGQVHDEFGQHIGQMIKEMADLKLFARNCRGRTFEDAETMAMVEAAVDHYGTLHRDLFSLRGQKGYTNYKESWTATESMDNIDMAALKERFTRRVFDERLMDALPIVHRAYTERKNKVGEEFEAWANSLLDEDDEDGDFSPFANSADPERVEIDTDGGNTTLDELFTKHGFEFKFLDGKYYFESEQEVERAKDIIAAHDPKMKFPPMAVYNYGYGTYGSTTNDLQTGTYSSLGMEESVKQGVAEGFNGIGVDIEPELDYDVVYVDINGKKYNFNYWYTDEKPTDELGFRKDIPQYLEREEWYKRLDQPTKMEVLHAVVQAELGNEPSEYNPTVGDEPMNVGDELDESKFLEDLSLFKRLAGLAK